MYIFKIFFLHDEAGSQVGNEKLPVVVQLALCMCYLGNVLSPSFCFIYLVILLSFDFVGIASNAQVQFHLISPEVYLFALFSRKAPPHFAFLYSLYRPCTSTKCGRTALQVLVVLSSGTLYNIYPRSTNLRNSAIYKFRSLEAEPKSSQVCIKRKEYNNKENSRFLTDCANV